MIIKKINNVPALPVEMEGAQDVSVRVLFGPKDNAPTFALRQFELAPGGCTPFHNHPFEHEVVVMQGNIDLVREDGETPIAVGDVVLVNPDEKHRFRNASDAETARMLCIVPVEYQK